MTRLTHHERVVIILRVRTRLWFRGRVVTSLRSSLAPIGRVANLRHDVGERRVRGYNTNSHRERLRGEANGWNDSEYGTEGERAQGEEAGHPEDPPSHGIPDILY